MLQDRFESAIRTVHRDARPAAVMFLDMDGFKDVNDSFGHNLGDELLRQISSRLVEALRETDTVARLGGDEFAVVVEGIGGVEEAEAVAAKILESLETPYIVGEQALSITASIGIALCPLHGDDVSTLLQRADLAMYTAKRQKNSYALYSAGQDDGSSERLTLTTELRQVIEQGGLTLFYQPKVSIATGQIIGVEALVRWPHPQKGLIMPNQFIPLAEQTGLIRPLSQWVLKDALRQLRAWNKADLDITVAINLSMRDLRDPRLSDEIARLLDEWSVDPSRLHVEITETMILADPQQTMAVVTQLHEMGITFCIDDFGTGYSSLSYLKELPASGIKIDKSFVMGLLTNASDAAIVQSVIDLAHNLGRITVAEGVETVEVWDRLAALGCDVAQGYYMGHPMPADTFREWLLESPFGLPLETDPIFVETRTWPPHPEADG